MRYLNIKFILMSVALTLCASTSFALPPCSKWLFKNNCVGSKTYSTGNKYVGEYKNGKRHGKGTFYFVDDAYSIEGIFYKGDLKKGTLTWQGISYTGEFKDWTISGQGTATTIDGDKVNGIWQNGSITRGTMTFSNGDSYVGNLKSDGLLNIFRHGQGTFTLTNGDKYTGNWRNDKMHGKGEMTYANGERNNGTWKNGIFQPKPKVVREPKLASTSEQNETFKVASGTGFYVSAEGHIITNNHVIDGCKEIKVHFKGRVLETLQIAADEQNDLALLKAAEAPSQIFSLSKDSPYPLQEIIVAGFPFGDKYSSSLKFTQGIVSSLTGMGNNYSEVQIDAALQQGNSGGPIIDEYGNIIAVAVSKLDAKYMFDNFGIIPENTNFGVKVSAVRNLMEANGISLKAPNTEAISRQELSQQATNGTVFLTCWMTMAQREKLRSRKVMFEDLE